MHMYVAPLEKGEKNILTVLCRYQPDQEEYEKEDEDKLIVIEYLRIKIISSDETLCTLIAMLVKSSTSHLLILNVKQK